MREPEFAAVRASTDLEAACHVVFNEATDIVAQRGRGALTEGLLTVICVETFFGETCNGGLYQYLMNQSPTASACPDALRRVGLAEYTEIIEKTLQLCTNTAVLDEFGDQEDNFDVEFTSDDPLEELDERFLKLYFADEEEFRRHLFQYIVEHEAEFVEGKSLPIKPAVKPVHTDGKPLLFKEQQRQKDQQIRLEYNRKCRDVHERIDRDGLPCPHCGVHARDIRFLDGNGDREAYFICGKCSRSFGLRELGSLGDLSE